MEDWQMIGILAAAVLFGASIAAHREDHSGDFENAAKESEKDYQAFLKAQIESLTPQYETAKFTAALAGKIKGVSRRCETAHVEIAGHAVKVTVQRKYQKPQEHQFPYKTLGYSFLDDPSHICALSKALAKELGEGWSSKFLLPKDKGGKEHAFAALDYKRPKRWYD